MRNSVSIYNKAKLCQNTQKTQGLTKSSFQYEETKLPQTVTPEYIEATNQVTDDCESLGMGELALSDKTLSDNTSCETQDAESDKEDYFQFDESEMGFDQLSQSGGTPTFGRHSLRHGKHIQYKRNSSKSELVQQKNVLITRQFTSFTMKTNKRVTRDELQLDSYKMRKSINNSIRRKTQLSLFTQKRMSTKVANIV